MSDRIKGLKANLLKMVQENRALADELETKGESATEEEHKQLAQGITAAKMLKDKLGNLQFLEDTESELTRPDPEEEQGKGRKTWDSPAEPKIIRPRWASVKNFHRDSRRESEEAAYGFGMWFAAAFGRAEDPATAKAREWIAERGIKLMSDTGVELKTMKESVNTTGGFLVPPEFDNDLIDLRETYGLFRQFARIVPMMRDTKSIGRRTSGLTAYFAGEATAPTESEKAWDQVTLTARKLMTLTRVSSELNEDIIVSLGDDLAGEIAYAFANKEDECGFNGDGTSTYGGINGVRNRLKDVYGAGGGVGLVVGAGNAYSELTLANFNSVVGSLPEYADRPDSAWFCSRFFWATVMQRLAVAAGGVTAEEIEGKRLKTFLGYPVKTSQVMPKTEGNSQVPVVFGSLRLAARFGDRRQTVISMSEHRYFDTDEIGVKGTERFDIVVHDVGDATNAGPVVGLITASS